MLKKDRAALLVIDIQGRLATLMHRRESLFQNVIRMIKGARVLDVPVIWTEQLPDKLGPTAPEIGQLLKEHRPQIKKAFSCCGDPGFLKELQSLDRNQILLTGIETHICVYQTAVDLLGSGYEVHLVQDAVSSRIEDNYRLGIDRIRQAGAKITSVEMCLFEMLGVAEGERFKQIIEIVK